MPLFSHQNEYQGVNAHFQSYCQAENDWESFHGQFISELAKIIGQALPIGYVVKPEQGLQIRELDWLRHEERRFGRKSYTIMHQTPPKATLTLKMINTFDPNDYLRSLNIYEIDIHPHFGQLVVHLEILSVSNKRGGSGFENYRQKRLEILSTGAHLVEIDLLHESDSPIDGIPSYRQEEPNAAPYYLAISISQPRLSDITTDVYQFGVGSSIPLIEIPLKNSDKFLLACQSAYDAAFAGITAFSYVVDYEQVPVNFLRYSPTDQNMIQILMWEIHSRI